MTLCSHTDEYGRQIGEGDKEACASERWEEGKGRENAIQDYMCCIVSGHVLRGVKASEVGESSD